MRSLPRRRIARCIGIDPAARAAGAGADAGDPQELLGSHRGASPHAGRRRLADDPAFVRRLGLQPARSDHAGQRQPAAAGVGVCDRRQQRARSRAGREQRRDVRLDAVAPGRRDRCEDRRDPLALHQGGRRERRRAASHVARRRALRRQGLLRGQRRGAGGARRAHRRGGLDHQGRGEQERLLHDARAARRRTAR